MMKKSSMGDIGQLMDLSIHDRIIMYIAYMELVGVGHIGNFIHIGHMEKDWYNVDGELRSARKLYFVTQSSHICSIHHHPHPAWPHQSQ